MKIFLAAALTASNILMANAATIETKQIDGTNMIAIVGKIEAGDERRFDAIASTINGPTLVFLDSPGGELTDGLDIGLMIHRKGFATVVPNNALCASVCGMIWLGGEKRGLDPSSKIGFHAAAYANGESAGPGNALIGAYLKEIGFSYGTIAYLTNAAPDEMEWLTPEAANKYGIRYILLDPPKAEPKPFQPPNPTPSPSTDQAGQSYAQGRQARIEYEQWVAGLPAGDYRDGVLYWAAHRSLKPQPDCVDSTHWDSTEWVAGCNAARTRLTPSDALRASNKNFWYGWNSL